MNHKMLSLLIFSIFSLSVEAKLNWYQMDQLMKKQTQKDLMTLLRDFISASKPARVVSLPGHDKARNFILDKIQEFDSNKTGKTLSQDFKPDFEKAKNLYITDFNLKIKNELPANHPEHIKWKKFTEYMLSLLDKLAQTPGKNIVWEKKGKKEEKEVLVLTAHYDTVSHNSQTLEVNFQEEMPGADYNASGVSVLLELVKFLSQVELDRTVRLVFLDYQAFGFLGSDHYARELKNEAAKEKLNILGVVNLEMLGHDSLVMDKTKKKGNMKAYLRAENDPQANLDKTLYEKFNTGGKRAYSIKFEPFQNSFENSDNIRFWEQGFPCMTLSQNWEDDFNQKSYQTKDDFAEMLNQLTLYNSYLYAASGTLQMLQDL